MYNNNNNKKNLIIILKLYIKYDTLIEIDSRLLFIIS
jgi:hypothetical protein